MRCVIAGSRTISNYELIREAFTLCDWRDRITEIVSGKARGVDTLGERIAEEFGLDIKEFPADWDRYRNAAGPIRNKEMALYCDIAIIVMEGKSVGSKDMVKQMKKLKKPHIVFEVRGDKLCQVK